MSEQYQIPEETSPQFQLQYDSEGRILSLRHPGDRYGMNWAKSAAGCAGDARFYR